MKQIQKLFKDQGIQWIYLNYPGHTIWIDRSNRLNALRLLGELGYRLRVPGKVREEFGSILDHPTDSIARVNLVWSLEWLSLSSIEGQIWERKVTRHFAEWDTGLATPSHFDRWILHLASLMHQDERSMDAWVSKCLEFTGQANLDWARFMSLLTLNAPGPMLAKVIQIAVFWNVAIPKEVIDQVMTIEKQGKLARELRKSLERNI